MSRKLSWRMFAALVAVSLVGVACGSNRQDEILARINGSAASAPTSGDGYAAGSANDGSAGEDQALEGAAEGDRSGSSGQAPAESSGNSSKAAGQSGAAATGSDRAGTPSLGNQQAPLSGSPGTPVVGAKPAARNADPETGVFESKVKIGFVCTLSGPFVEVQKRTCQLAQAQVKRANERGINGRKIEFIVVDDQFTNAGMGSANIRRLVEQDKVFAILAIAPFTCSVIGQYIDSKRVPLFCDGVFETEYGHDWIWFPQPKTIVLVAHLSAQWIVENLGKRVAVVTHPTVQWAAGAAQLKRTIEAKGGQVIREVDVAEDEGDYTAAVVNVRASNPDAVYLNLMPDGVIKWYLAAQRVNFRPQTVSGATGDVSLVPDGLGDFVFPYRAGTTFTPPRRGTPAGDAYFQTYEKYFPGTDWRPSSVNDRTTHCLFLGFIQALEQAGPELTRATFARALDGGSFDCGLSPPFKGWKSNSSPYNQGLLVEWTRDPDGAITPKALTGWMPGP